MLKLSRARKAMFTVMVAIAAIGAFWLCLPPPPIPLEAVSYSQRVYDRNGRLLRLTLSRDEKYRIHTPLEQISPNLIEATLLHEDRHYWNHPGINPVAVLRSAWHFCLAHIGRGGASTVSMQLARIRYGLRTRTVPGKLVQMFRALQLERHYTKRQILEAYLNLAPYGRNIEGVGAASLLYFGKTPARLTLHEAVALSVIPQSPARRTPLPDRENDDLTAATARLYSRLLAHRGTVAPNNPLDEEFRARTEVRRVFAAPHLVSHILTAQPAAKEISTTLDLSLQRMIERRISQYIETNSRLGIQNAAAMLIDSTSMEVLAEVGSANFFDATISGQVNGTQSRRSPGSTLKPFIYALAIDAGLIHPLTLLTDAPRSFGGYNPENFDRDFAGPIRASEALARSRNVPAVSLAAQLSRPTLYEFLKRGGVALPRGEQFYGLSLPLGGGEVTMEELVRLYAALANGGRLRPIYRTLPHVLPPSGPRLFSPEAAFLTLEMLGESPRPGLNEGTGSESIFWKTGTSHGFRDAWSVAVFDHYVLAVWVGNFDGRSNPAFVGRTCAAPLLFGILDALRSHGVPRTAHEPPPGANLQQVEFCAVSGQLPNPTCTHRVKGWFLPGISSIKSCDIHREVLIDVETGLRISRDDGTRTLRRETYEFWPSDLLKLFRAAGIPRRQPPPFLPGSHSGAEAELTSRAGQPPRIISPQSGHVYALRPGDEFARTLPLRAQAEADVSKLYWFADKAFLGISSPREPFYWHPTPGTYKIVALDDFGRSTSCTVRLQVADVP
ncbi:penicillin-binding protein 1C [Verrucomicrobiota bacterium sgz303538]